jgi:hypothetical protein
MHIFSRFFLQPGLDVHLKNKPIPEEGLFRSVSELVGNFIEAAKTVYYSNKLLQNFANYQIPKRKKS